MKREFLQKVVKSGIVCTRKHVYKRIFEHGFLKVIREDGIVLAVYAI